MLADQPNAQATEEEISPGSSSEQRQPPASSSSEAGSLPRGSFLIVFRSELPVAFLFSFCFLGVLNLKKL